MEKKSERKVQRVFLRKSGTGRLDEFYAIFKDDKIYKWDYQNGEWRPFWKKDLTDEIRD